MTTKFTKYAAIMLLGSALVTPVCSQESNSKFSIGFSYLNASLDGFVQTPAGGEPGTTSRSRPDFAELGFDRQNAFDAYASITKGRHSVEIGAQWQRQSGKSVVKKDLISQKKAFPAGTHVDANIQTDWYRINYLYHMNSNNQNLSLAAGGGLVWFNFDYQLKSNNAKADRAYSKVGYRAGARIDWQLNDKLSLSSQVFAPIPLSNTPEIWTAEINANYSLWKIADRELQLLAGVGYNRLDYEDEQKVPNHIRVEMAPYVKLGLSMNF